MPTHFVRDGFLVHRSSSRFLPYRVVPLDVTTNICDFGVSWQVWHHPGLFIEIYYVSKSLVASATWTTGDSTRAIHQQSLYLQPPYTASKYINELANFKRVRTSTVNKILLCTLTAGSMSCMKYVVLGSFGWGELLLGLIIEGQAI